MIVERGGTTVAVQESGTGRPVVMVMGAGSPGRVWQAHQAPALTRAGYRVLVPDLRGVGASPAGPPATGLGDLADDVLAVIEERVGGPAALVGTSLGARVVWEAALRRPDLVVGLCLLAVQARPAAVSTVYAEAQIALGTVPARPAAEVRAALGAVALSPASLHDDGCARDWFDVLDLAPWPMSDGAVRHYRIALGEFPAGAPDAPTTVVAFADDAVCPLHLCREVADAVPHARLHIVEAAGHLGYLERPAEVSALLLGFLAELDGGVNSDETEHRTRGSRW